jgi:hypothetical protein
MGSDTAPSIPGDGNVLGTISFTDTTNESSPRTITVTGLGVYRRYNYVWLSVSSDPPTGTDQLVAEVTLDVIQTRATPQLQDCTKRPPGRIFSEKG